MEQPYSPHPSIYVTNQGEKDFYEEFLGAEKRLLDAAAAGDWTKEAKVIDLCKLFGSAETPLQELTTLDGTSVWAGDGVHLTSPAYRVAGRLLAAELERSVLGEAGEPATKRPRLESVVPALAPPPAKPVFTAPPPTPVAPPLWLSSQLPMSQKYSNSRDTSHGGYYGGGRSVAAEKEWAMEGAVAEAADAAVARTSRCVITTKK